jgi:hypothetical protein
MTGDVRRGAHPASLLRVAQLDGRAFGSDTRQFGEVVLRARQLIVRFRQLPYPKGRPR